MGDKKRFWDTEEGKLFSHAIHEHNSAIGSIKNYNLFYERNRHNQEILTEERIEAMIRNNKENIQKATDSMDLLYKFFKNKFESDNQ